MLLGTYPKDILNCGDNKASRKSYLSPPSLSEESQIPVKLSCVNEKSDFSVCTSCYPAVENMHRAYRDLALRLIKEIIRERQERLSTSISYSGNSIHKMRRTGHRNNTPHEAVENNHVTATEKSDVCSRLLQLLSLIENDVRGMDVRHSNRSLRSASHGMLINENNFNCQNSPAPSFTRSTAYEKECPESTSPSPESTEANRLLSIPLTTSDPRWASDAGEMTSLSSHDFEKQIKQKHCSLDELQRNEHRTSFQNDFIIKRRGDDVTLENEVNHLQLRLEKMENDIHKIQEVLTASLQPFYDALKGLGGQESELSF